MAILISDLAAVPMQDIGIPLVPGVIPILTLLALELAASSEWSMHFASDSGVFMREAGVYHPGRRDRPDCHGERTD